MYNDKEQQLDYMDECMVEDGSIYGISINFDKPYSNCYFVRFQSKERMLIWLNNDYDDLRQAVPQLELIY